MGVAWWNKRRNQVACRVLLDLVKAQSHCNAAFTCWSQPAVLNRHASSCVTAPACASVSWHVAPPRAMLPSVLAARVAVGTAQCSAGSKVSRYVGR